MSGAGRAKYRSYDPEAVTNAYSAVTDEKMSIRRACQTYGVPYNTLRDRVAGKIDPECCTMGGSPLLLLEEENQLVSHLKEMASMGYGYSRQEVVDIATNYALILGKKAPQDKPLTLNWFYGFLKRWPDLKVVKPRALEVSRAKAANTDNITNYFNQLEAALDKYDLRHKPQLIYNVDEKGITINHTPPRIVSGVEICPQAVVSGKGQTVTVIGCGNAVGNAIPPYMIFPGKRMNDELLQDATPGTKGKVSETGWSNSELFLDYLQNHFWQYVPAGENVILLLDRHKSHVSLTVIEWAKSHNIILQTLPAHTSHLLQPLDVGCYGPLQKIYNNACHKKIRLKECAITKFDVCGMVCKAYGTALSMSNLQSSFKKCGIYPFYRDIMLQLNLKPAEVFINDNEVESEENDRDDIVPDVDVIELSEVERVIENVEIVPDVDVIELSEVERVVENEELSREDACQVESDKNVEEDRVIQRNEFFLGKVTAVKKVKSERKKKTRCVLSAIVGGKTVTEDVIVEKVREHVAKQGRSNCNKRSKNSVSEKKVNAASKRKGGKVKKVVKKTRVCDSQKQGRSGINRICLSEDSESETESEISEEEKCCVCKRFQPEQLRGSISLIFTKWAKCDRCEHWVHLIYCTKVRVVRRGDSFYCTHCQD